jgi:hypothetical protein
VTQRLIIAASWLIAIGLIVFFVPVAAAALACQWALRKLRPAGSAPAPYPPGGRAAR